jgi:hypothetical protein
MEIPRLLKFLTESSVPLTEHSCRNWPRTSLGCDSFVHGNQGCRGTLHPLANFLSALPGCGFPTPAGVIGNQPGVSERIANHPWLSNPSENRTPQGVRGLRLATVLAFMPFVVRSLDSCAHRGGQPWSEATGRESLTSHAYPCWTICTLENETRSRPSFFAT